MRLREILKDVLDRFGLVALAYDLRARARYALDRGLAARNRSFRRSRHDGLPLPPPTLVYAVAGHFDLREYYESGVFHAALLRHSLADHGLDVESLGALLDFGCGCGRVTRQWSGLQTTAVHGSDYNGRLVEWCSRSLPFAQFDENGLEPPLPYRDAQFDFVYAISVFTHLTEELQHAWMRELERVVGPGGIVAITTKGASRVGRLDPSDLARFEQGKLVVQAARYAGRNLCAAYHPESYVRDQLAGPLEVIDFRAAEGDDQTQDLFLLRKPAQSPSR
jgi:SAM-dependent methyltransferase